MFTSPGRNIRPRKIESQSDLTTSNDTSAHTQVKRQRRILSQSDVSTRSTSSHEDDSDMSVNGNMITQDTHSEDDSIISMEETQPDSIPIEIKRPMYMNGGRYVGAYNYHQLTKEKHFVDKSDFITKALGLGPWILAFFRHRSSMKTTHLRAIETYCDFKPAVEIDFSKLKVGINESYHRKFCVFIFNFDMSYLDDISTPKDLVAVLRKMICLEVEMYLLRHLDEPNAVITTKEIMERISHATEALLLSYISLEMEMLFKRKTIILIDNVDMPFFKSDIRIVEYSYKVLFDLVFNNPARDIFKIIMMGNIIPKIFSKRSSFAAGIRCDIPYDSISLDEYFMFSVEEVKLLCERYNYPVEHAIDQFKLCFGGYGERSNCPSMMFNSYSIIQFCLSNSEFNLDKDSETPIKWSNFHSIDALHAADRIYISKAEEHIWNHCLNTPEKTIELISPNSLLDYEQFLDDFNIGLLFILYGGYLTLAKSPRGKHLLKIPNKEVLQIFLQRRRMFIIKPLTPNLLELWNAEFNSCTDNNYQNFCSLLNKALIKCSSCRT